MSLHPPRLAAPKEHSSSPEAEEIFTSIKKIQEQLQQVQQQFDFATDDILIDSYIHQLIALNKKYDYFLKAAKEMGLLAEGFSKTG